MATQKLYYSDPYLQAFTATVLEVIPLAGNLRGIVLDKTAFYPEGGGQPCDTGMLDDLPVKEVYQEGNKIVHVTATEPANKVVHGRLDWARRFDHMQQHSGEHILSAAFAVLYGAENIGFHLGGDGVFIDVTLQTLSTEQAAAAEQKANEYVFANKPVTTHHVTASDLDAFPLRKKPAKLFANLRLVNMADVDCCPCGGTHVATTGEVGLIKIRSWEKRAGSVRVEFVCGGRALADYSLCNTIVRQLSARLSAPIGEVPAALERHLDKTVLLGKELEETRQQLHQYIAQDIYDQATAVKGYKLACRHLPDSSPGQLADIAKKILARGSAIVLLGSVNQGQNKCYLLFAGTPGSAQNMGSLLKAVLPLIDGKGGGNANLAQGGGPYSSRLDQVLDQAKEMVLNG